MRRRSLILTTAAALAVPALSRAASEAAPDGPLRMRDLYEKTLDFSPLARELEGERVRVQGFMAPPLDPGLPFFVLTKRPLAVCPFCESEAEWPDDILAVYTKRALEPVAFNRPIEVSGILELGGYTDPDLGFVSRVRLRDATYGAAS